MSALAPQGSAHLSASGTRVGFPRSARLLRRGDFARVYQQGRRHFAAHMTLFYLRRAGGGGLRVGFSVGRMLGGAVERNRIKRRLREAVRGCGLEAHPAIDVVINPRKSLLGAQFAELRNEIGRAFEVIGRSVNQP